MPTSRRLAAVLIADVVGYSRLIGVDKGGTLPAFKTVQAELSEDRPASRPAHQDDGSRSLVAFSATSLAPPRQATEVQTRMGCAILQG